MHNFDLLQQMMLLCFLVGFFMIAFVSKYVENALAAFLTPAIRRREEKSVTGAEIVQQLTGLKSKPIEADMVKTKVEKIEAESEKSKAE